MEDAGRKLRAGSPGHTAGVFDLPYTKVMHDKPREKCAVFAAIGEGFDAARLTFFGLYALQHRGQEGSGIASSDGAHLHFYRASGLVNQIYTEPVMEKLPGELAIGHNRYSTSKVGDAEHLQPVIGQDRLVAVAHNGNLPSTKALESFLRKHGVSAQNLSDSELMAAAIRYYMVQGKSVEKAVKAAFPLFTGAFSLVVLTTDTVVAVRDACGIRPLSIGTLNGGYIVASETCALDTLHATFLRDVAPGEMVSITKKGVKSLQLAEPDQKLDIFEFVYFSRPDSCLLGKSVDAVRRTMGVELARETKIQADVVVPVPDSGISAALGFSETSGIPYYPALIKNRYIGRTFIQPEQHLREWLVRMKLNPIRSALEGKRVVMVDDSIVRGTTSPHVISMLREAGATEIYFVVSSPPYRYPDFYGIDTPAQDQLIAFQKTEEEIRQFLGVDSLHYLSYEGMIRATGLPESMLCTSCFTGVYPIDIGERKLELT
jgi:amidophosphoribosyltransferase